MRKSQILIFCGLSLLLVGFQNCGGGFDQSEMGSNSSGNDSAVLRERAQQVLTARCVSCHSATVPTAGVDVTDENALLFYRYIVPGEPQLSGLYNLIQDGEMPPGNPLSAEEAQAISDWILTGFTDMQAVSSGGN